MNCCNDFGECRQGRDCPARAKVAKIKMRYPDEALVGTDWRRLLRRAAMVMLVFATAVLWLAYIGMFLFILNRIPS